MNYVVIDTSGKNLTVVINKNGQIFKYFDAECGTSHSVALMPVIEDLAKKADFDFNDADFMGAVVGAGSFTGIRIGVATIKAMCFAYKKPCLSITSFDTLALKSRVIILLTKVRIVKAMVFPVVMYRCEVCESCSVMSDFLPLHGL